MALLMSRDFVCVTRAGKTWTLEELEVVRRDGEELSEVAVKQREDAYKAVPDMDK